MEEKPDNGDRQAYHIDVVNVITTNVANLEGMIIYKAHINDGFSQYTGYGATRAEAAIVALNKYAG